MDQTRQTFSMSLDLIRLGRVFEWVIIQISLTWPALFTVTLAVNFNIFYFLERGRIIIGFFIKQKLPYVTLNENSDDLIFWRVDGSMYNQIVQKRVGLEI